MGAVVGTNKLAQVGFIVKDIYEAKKKWAEFLGVEEPPVCDAGSYEITQTVFKGKPAPEAGSLLAFFDVGEGLQIELIQPNEAPSTWREFLNEHGEGIHHLAFQIKDMNMKQAIANCEDFGMDFEQKGEYGSGDGRYAYLSAKNDLKTMIELLESDN